MTCCVLAVACSVCYGGTYFIYLVAINLGLELELNDVDNLSHYCDSNVDRKGPELRWWNLEVPFRCKSNGLKIVYRRDK